MKYYIFSLILHGFLEHSCKTTNTLNILAARAGRKIVTMDDIEEASEKVAYGPAMS